MAANTEPPLLLAPTLLGALMLYLIVLGTYRLHFSPLASIPGPRLAALTYWYEIYYDVWHKGRYLWKIVELHKRYGPIVRINPNEVHISDLDFYDTIYSSGSKHLRNKTKFLAIHNDNMFQTLDAREHRARRAAVSKPFSKQSIRDLQPALEDVIGIAAERLAAAATNKTIIEIHALWNSLTQDVIGRYAFGTTNMKGLRNGREDAQFLGLFDDWPYMNQFGRAFPWVLTIVSKLPQSWLSAITPKFKRLAAFDRQIRSQIADVLATETPLIGAKNVFHEMRDSNYLPAKDKNPSYYQSEAISFIGGGTETTAAALSTLSYWLAASTGMLERLREELDSVMRGNEVPSLQTLEALPFLTGVVQEGIRLSFGVPGRLPRYSPNEDIKYGNYILPRGTIMSSSSYMYSTDEQLFPDPFSFNPQRWIEDPSTYKLTAFSRGSRGCIGINLAYAELYLTVAMIFSRFDLTLYNTTARDVEIVGDGVIGMRPGASKGIRFTIKQRVRKN